MSRPTVLVVAKAPVPGRAKTRVAAEVGDDVAADLAAAALLDTLDAAVASGLPVTVALTGDLTAAARSADVRTVLDEVVVVPQVGETFGERLAHAHLDADRGHGVVQVGMDTPQLTADDLRTAADRLGDSPAVLGPAADGGWWLLALRRGADASGLPDVPMSTSSTAADTRHVLPEPVALLRSLRDVDTWSDAVIVAAELPGSRFAAAVEAVAVRGRA